MVRDVKKLLQHLQADAIQPLDNGAVHQWSQNEIDALHLALAAERPLLVRGEPGTGKTQLALAAAAALTWHLQCVTVSPRFEAQDLFHRFDAVQRLADAQAAGAGGGGVKRDQDYWLPGPFWRAFDWSGASGYGPRSGESPVDEVATLPGHVILIDEIDKADSDVPNSLLEVLGSREFPNPVNQQPIRPQDGLLPLVVITTNEERELPAAFLRRCVVLTLEPDKSYVDFLVKRGRAHFPSTLKPADRRKKEEEIFQTAAEQLAEDRKNAKAAGVPPPGLAEYIDLLTALRRLAPGNPEQQGDWLARLARYAFLKNGVVEDNPKLSQNRPVADKADSSKG